MSSYTRNQPQPTDTLAVSQPFLYNNTNSADSFFGVDHYAFSAAANNGLHNTVTQPAYQNPIGTPSATPPDTSAGSPIIYGFKPTSTGNIPAIQFSRGPANVVPSPLTTLQSTAAPIVLASLGTTNVLDATNLNMLYGSIYMFNVSNPFVVGGINFAQVYWDGTIWVVANNLGTNALTANINGNILRVRNTTAVPMNNVFWTLQILRVQ